MLAISKTAVPEPELTKYMNRIKNSLNILYDKEIDLFQNDLSERAIVFRFAYHLQKQIENDYFVDCDYNSSYVLENWHYIARKGKNIENPDWGLTWRFIDIILRSSRVPNHNNTDIICFECKKRNNIYREEGMEKDKNNLKILTTIYGYQYWFHLIFWKEKYGVKITVYKYGKIYSEFYLFL